MKLTAPRRPLIGRVALARQACAQNHPRAILQDVLIQARDGRVDLTATDELVSVRTSLVHEGVTGSGATAFPAATLLSALKEVPGEVVEIEESGSQHVLTAGSTVFKLYADDPIEFPSIPTTDMSRAARIPLAGFLDLCQRTMFAAARKLGRYVLNGVLVELAPEGVVLVATDGRRLAMARLPCETGVVETRSRILPIKGLQQLMRAAEPEDELRVDLRESQVTFGVGSTEIIAQLIDGEFPDYKAVIPDGRPNQVVLARDDLAGAIRRAAVTAGEEARSVALCFRDGTLTVSSRSEGLGEARSALDVEYAGPDVDVCFNPDFLSDYLRAVPEEQVSFSFSDGKSAGLFSSTNGEAPTDDVDGRYIVMPVVNDDNQH